MRRWGIIIIAGLIAGILAGIAVLWYTEQVEMKRVTEMSSTMRTIIVSQKVQENRTGKYYSASTIAEFKTKGIDITDTKYFIYETFTTPDGGFTVTATATDAFGAAGEWVKYIYEPGKSGRWTSPGSTLPHPMLHIEPYLER